MSVWEEERSARYIISLLQGWFEINYQIQIENDFFSKDLMDLQSDF